MRLWKYDPLPLPNDGACPFCGHDHGPRFGRFYRGSCSKLVGAIDLMRNIQAMSGRAWIRAAVGGPCLAGLLVLLAFVLDSVFFNDFEFRR